MCREGRELRPGWSFALLFKFEFWEHVMESMQNAKLQSSANIGEGGSLLDGIPIKSILFASLCQTSFSTRGSYPPRDPPSKMQALIFGFAKRTYVFAKRGPQKVFVFIGIHGTLPPDGVSRCYASLRFGRM